jgi:uncharacterized repeat protein (TIGR01451 family)/gliding motility-associated-like protein
VAPVINTNKTTICGTDKATLTATGCESGTITWSLGGTGSTKEVGAGTYTATCTSSCGVSGNSNTVTVTIGSLPSAPTITSPTTEICGTTAITLTATGCSGSIKWSNSQTGNIANVSLSGDYTAVCITNCGESVRSNVIKVTIGVAPSAPLITTDRINVCGSEKARLSQVGCMGTIKWSTNETTSIISVGAGIYTAKCINACGESVNSNSIKIESGGLPTAPKITANRTSICGVDSAKLSADNCSGTVKWSNDKVGSAIYVKLPGSYTATCNNDCGLSQASTAIVITSGGNPSAPILVATQTKICSGDSAVISTDGCSGTLTWSTGATGNKITVKTANTYTAKCKTACGESGNSNAIIVELKTTGCTTTPCGLPKLILSASKLVVCEPVDITLTASGCTTGGEVVWSNGTAGASIVVKPLMNSTYTAVCKTSTCVGPLSDVLSIVVNKANKPLVSCATDLVCPGESVELKAYECQGITKWSNGMSGSSIIVTPNALTKYTAVCVLGTCTSEVSDTLCVNVGSPSVPFITCRTSTICLGESAIITAQGCVGTVVWSNNQKGTVLTVTPTVAGISSYTAKCVSKGGTCESKQSNKITITTGGTIATPTVIPEIKNTCPFESVNLGNAILGEPSTSGGIFEFHTSNSAQSSLITTPSVAVAGTYYLFERSKFGCFSNPVTIKVKIESCGPGSIKPDSSKAVDIQLAKSGNSRTVDVGKKILYTIVVKNNATQTATHVVIRDVVPAGLTIDSLSANAKLENGVVVAKFDSVRKADNLQFSYRAVISAAGKIVNKAELYSVDQVDNVLANNTSSFTINDLKSADLIGLAKAVGEAVKVSENVYNVPFTLYLQNMGSNVATSVQVIDSLDKTFGNGAVILDEKIALTGDAGLVVNPNFTGRGSNTRLLVDSLSTLPVGKSTSIKFTVKVDISKATTSKFYNTAMLKGKGSNAVALSDKSANGSNPDPDGDGNPLNNDELSPISLGATGSEPSIACALNVYDSSFVDNLTYQVKYRALIKNTGSVILKSISLGDSLKRTFPDSVQFTIVGKPLVPTSSTLKVNPNFNGKTDTRLLLSDSTGKLLVGQTDTVMFTVNLRYLNNYGPYFNNVLAKGIAPNGVVVSDSSNAGSVIVANSSRPTVFSIKKKVNPNESVLAKIIVPDGFSPNRDGKNDKLVILTTDGIEVEVESFNIYNRWGELVWKSGALKINAKTGLVWDGTSNTGARFGTEGVADGTYYYNLKIKDLATSKRGFLTLLR